MTAARTGLRRPRKTTPGKTIKAGDRKLVIPRPPQRHCNGCKRRLGDMTHAELVHRDQALKAGTHPRLIPYPDVRGECPNCTPNPPGLSWRFALVDKHGAPYERAPLTSNGGHGNRFAKAADVKHLRQFSALKARALRIPPLARVRIDLHWTPAKGTRADPSNLHPTRKAAEDGICGDAFLVPDDTPQWSEPRVPIIDAPDPASVHRLYVVIYELQPPEEMS